MHDGARTDDRALDGSADETLHATGLTDAQARAVAHHDGPLLVLAGPGSGKTRVITHRIAFLIANGVPAWQVLALTFTNKAAGEMRDRVDELVPADAPGRTGLVVSTFHSFCVRLLRRHADAAHLAANFTIYDTADQREAVKQAMSAADLSTSNWSPAGVLGAISNAKNQLLTADAFAQEAHDFRSRAIARAYREYERILTRNDAVDFDDLLMKTAALLREREDVRAQLQDRWRYILIDEYQDTNHAQFVIAHTLAAAHRNICVVGDPDQSIYAWRGADIRNILEFEEHYPDAVSITLDENFRSTGHILAVAGRLIEHNAARKAKDLYSGLGEGEPVTCVTARDERHEAEIIVDWCRRLHDDEDIPWREMAVLYRINAISRVMEDAFRRAGVPYVIARGTAFFERKEIRDALAYLRFAANPSDDVSLRRIINTPTRGIGKTTLDRVEIHAIANQQRFYEALRQAGSIDGLTSRATKSVGKFCAMIDAWRATLTGGPEAGLLAASASLGEFVERVITESGLEKAFRSSPNEEDQQRLANLAELVSAAAEFRPPPPDRDDEPVDDWSLGRLLGAFLESVTLVSDADMVDASNGAVTLMTLHAAKGLEFDAVAMAALEEGVLPHARAIGTESELEEERRLCFVGITRARKHLHLSRAAYRTQRGMRQGTIQSTFLRELPVDSLTTIDLAGDRYDPDAALRRRLAGGGDDWPPAGDVHPDDLNQDPDGGAAGAALRKFPPGCLVNHRTFGVGRVVEISRDRDPRVRINFTTVGMKTLILEYAPLTRVDD